ncbi:glycosyltransferase family 4 protein [Pyxidicoccus sp. MSG2]|uniref:glycosyltransferase family 4 protein n=1 Tax=Pyxidicoccus sp. MSG2 TaxID=2996790 RepID=UPI0022715D98|nr:glycosyltransferase [Pyxidicoccus sp. MSG2]MCY1014830.1 glycosyltransferase [Pyxidicoccus sp. MSG2]
MSDLPRLLLCSFDVIPGPSGSSRRVTEYLKALPDRFSVVVLSAKTPDHSHIEKYQGARLLRVPVGSGDLASRIQAFERAVRRQLESEEYALAHFTDPFGGYALCELKADYGHRLVYEAQTFPSQELRYTHPQTEGDRRFLSKIRRQELFCLMNADLIITGSQTTRSYIQSLGASDDLIHVVRAPVDLKAYEPEAMGAPDGQPLRLMYLGSQVGWQGLPTLLRAVALAAQRADVRLTLVGAQHADWQPHLDDLVKELGLKERVEFQAPVLHDDVAKVLALADVGVLPLDDVERNRLQGGPLAKVSEYCAAGRPVIAADLPVTRELIPQSAALFFPPGDTQALANHIVDLARDVPRRMELGRRARAHAEQVLDAGLIRGRLLDLYDSLLEKRSASVAPRSEDDLPAPTTVTGTPTNRLAALLPPEPTPRKEASKPEAAQAGSSEPTGEDVPLVMGQVLDEGLDTRLIKTELESQPSEPPVVMGLPLRESSAKGKGAESASPASVIVDPALPTSSRAGTESGGPVSLRYSPPGKATSPSLVEEPPAPTPTPTPIVRGSSTADREEPPAPTPVVRAPVAQDAEEPPSPTPVVRAPSRADAEEPPAPTPIVRAPSRADAEEPPAPTPIIRAPSRVEAEEPPAPTPVVRAPVAADREEPFSPRVSGAGLREESPGAASGGRTPATSDRDEPPAPTPIVKVPAALFMRDEAFAPSSAGRDSGTANRKDEPPAPGGASRSLSGGRSTSARVETPSRRMSALSTPARGTSATESERAPSAPRSGSPTSETGLPPVVRPGSPTSEPGLPPVVRPGSSPSETGLPPVVRSGPQTSETALPPVLRSGPPTSETALPPVLRSGPQTSELVIPQVPRSGSASHDSGLPPMIRGGTPSSEAERPPPVLRPGTAPSESGLPPMIRGGAASSDVERPLPVLRPGSSDADRLAPIRGNTAGADQDRAPPIRGGLPAADQDRPPSIRGGTTPSEPERPPALPPRATAPPPVPRQRPPRLMAEGPPRLAPVDVQASRPAPPSLKASLPASASSEDEPEEISPDEAQSIDDGSDTSPTPAHSRPRLDEPDEISSDEVEEAEVSVANGARLLEDAELHEVEAEPASEPEDEGAAPEPVPSALNPWFAQLAHGYCPPDGIRFDRHTPPTTFPGRDEDTSPSRVPPAVRTSPGVGRGKSS